MQEYRAHYDGGWADDGGSGSGVRSNSSELKKPRPQKYFFPNHMLNMTSKEYNEFIEYMNAQVNNF